MTNSMIESSVAIACDVGTLASCVEIIPSAHRGVNGRFTSQAIHRLTAKQHYGILLQG